MIDFFVNPFANIIPVLSLFGPVGYVIFFALMLGISTFAVPAIADHLGHIFNTVYTFKVKKIHGFVLGLIPFIDEYVMQVLVILLVVDFVVDFIWNKKNADSN